MLETLLFHFLLQNPPLSEITPKNFIVPPQIHLTLVTKEGQKNAPTKKQYFVGPVLQAESAFAVDIDSRTVLFEKNGQEKRQIASISKLITAIIILEKHALDETVTVSKNASQVDGRKIGLKQDEKILLENLMYGLLIHSGNDAAIALAEHDSGNVDAFVKKMNEKVKTLGLKDTHFSNPAGLDDEKNYSTANDVALFALEALDQSFIRSAVQIKEKEISSIDSKQKHRLETTDELLKDPLFPIKGLKTGNTLGAGPSFVGFMEKDNHRILTVILGSEDRFKDTKILLDWVFRAYNW